MPLPCFWGGRLTQASRLGNASKIGPFFLKYAVPISQKTCRATQLKELYDKKTELENLEIVNTVRSMVMDKDQIMAFLAAMKDGKAEKAATTQQEVTDND